LGILVGGAPAPGEGFLVYLKQINFAVVAGIVAVVVGRVVRESPPHTIKHRFIYFVFRFVNRH
jgi:hypothetical protein